MSQLKPQDFVISRKRKKYKFALFANSPLGFEFDQWTPDWQPTVLEIGAGTGLFSVELAAAAPGERFLAVDVKADRLQAGARAAEAAGLGNIRFLRARVDLLPALIAPRQLRHIWLTFPDPFPKKRAAKHRLTNRRFLDLYQTLLAPGGRLHLKHDDLDFFHYSLEQLAAAGWLVDELSFDLHGSSLPAEYKILTTYERRWLAAGAKINFLSARPA